MALRQQKLLWVCLILIAISSYDPDEHFKLSRTSVSARYAATTLRYVTEVLTLNFGSRPKKKYIMPRNTILDP